MKVLVVSDGRGKEQRIDCGTDSAVLRPGEPVFVPDPPADWRSSIVPAVRISRLGMSIKESKARDYFSEITAFHLLEPASEYVVEGIPPYILDRAFSPGKWLDIEAAGATVVLSASTAPIGADSGKGHELSVSFALGDLEIEHTVSRLSRYITFKTGDILVFTRHRLELGAPQLDTAVKAAINCNEVLSLRIK